MAPLPQHRLGPLAPARLWAAHAQGVRGTGGAPDQARGLQGDQRQGGEMGGLGSPFGSGGGVVPFVSFFVGGGFKGKPKRKAFVVLFYGIPKRNALFFWGGPLKKNTQVLNIKLE